MPLSPDWEDGRSRQDGIHLLGSGFLELALERIGWTNRLLAFPPIVLIFRNPVSSEIAFNLAVERNGGGRC